MTFESTDLFFNIVTTGIWQGNRGDRRSPWGQLIYDRSVEIGVGGHGQGPGNWRGGHGQQMRLQASLNAFLAQQTPRTHTKTVLLVDDN